MSTQESLTFLFDAIACGFIVIATIDLSREIITLYKQTFVARQKPTLITSPQPQQLSQLPDPWLLPQEETVAPDNRSIPEQPKPVLLLAPALAMGEEQSSSVGEVQSPGQCETMLRELLLGVDLNKLPLRQARKIAKVLGIAQKVRGRDQKLAFLRGQIKLKLQEMRSLQPEVVAVIREELIAC